MKKVEIPLAAISILAIVFKILHYPGSGPLIILSLSTLSLIYGYLGFLVFNGLSLRNVFKKGSFKGISTKHILGAVGTGFVLSTAAIAIVFRLQSYPGAKPMMMIGGSGLILILLFSAFKFKKDPKGYYKRILKRAIPFGVVILLISIISKEDVLHLQYPDNPEYIDIYMKAYNNPDSTELWDEVQKAHQKMDSIQLEKELNEN